MNLSVVLSGGAARGAFHLGVLHFLEEQNIAIKAYSGSSIGSIIAVSHSSGIKAKEQLKIFMSKDLKQCIEFNYFLNGFFKINPNKSIINELLPLKNLEDLSTKVWVNAYDIKNKQLHCFNQGDIKSLCLASSALIPMFRPISYNNMYLIDGGLFDNIPIKPLLDLPYETLCIDLLPKKEVQAHEKKKFSLLKLFKKKLFSTLIENNKFSQEHTTYYLSTQNLLEFKMFSFDELQSCFDLGYKEASKFFLKI